MSDPRLESVLQDLVRGVDPTVASRIQSLTSEVIKLADTAGVKMPEGSITKGATESGGIANLMEGLSCYQKELKPKTKKRMMRCPNVSFANAALTGPIIGCEWGVECADHDIADFHEAWLKPLWTSVIASAGDAIGLGAQWFEKIYEIRQLAVSTGEEDEQLKIYPNAAVYKELYDVDPEGVKAKTKNGELIGYQVGKAFVSIDPNGQSVDKGAVVTMPRVRWGNYYGEGRLEVAYEPWWMKTATAQFMMRYLERLGDPPLIGRAPRGETTLETGEKKDNLDIMLGSLKYVRSHGIIVLPFEVDPVTNLPMWDVKILEDQPRASMFLEVLEHFAILIMRAYLQPEKRLVEGKAVGSYANLKIQSGVAEMIASTLQQSMFEQLSRMVLPPITILNFGPNAPEATLVPGAMSQTNIDILETVLQAIVDYEKGVKTEHPLVSLVDDVELLKALRVPLSKEPQEETEEVAPEVAEETEPLSGEEEETGLPVMLASRASDRARRNRQLRDMASDWLDDEADPILEEEINKVTRKVEKALNQPTEAKKIAALAAITVPWLPYRKSLLSLLTDSEGYGRTTVAEDMGFPKASEMSATDKRLFGVLSKNLATDRSARLETIVNVAGLAAIRGRQKPEAAAFAIRKRATKRLGQSNAVTSRSEVQRGYSAGRTHGALSQAPESDPIVAATFHVTGLNPCPLCEALNGQTIEADHPDFFSYMPPQHHNCGCEVEYHVKSETPSGGFKPFRKPPQEVIDAADEYFVPKEALSAHGACACST